MRLPFGAHTIPGRIVTGGFILHSGLDKRRGNEETAGQLHGMAAGAFPFLSAMPPKRFLRVLSAGEIATGAILLSPFAPSAVAGTALTAFSGSLVTLYARTPALRQPGSVWPTPAGIGISKDVWMLGIGLGLLVDALTGRRKG